VTVTLLDGLVLAFHHSMNYKSVVIFGTATTVQDTDQKLEAPEPLPNTWYQGGGQTPAQSSGITGNFGALPTSD